MLDGNADVACLQIECCSSRVNATLLNQPCGQDSATLKVRELETQLYVWTWGSSSILDSSRSCWWVGPKCSPTVIKTDQLIELSTDSTYRNTWCKTTHPILDLWPEGLPSIDSKSKEKPFAATHPCEVTFPHLPTCGTDSGQDCSLTLIWHSASQLPSVIE